MSNVVPLTPPSSPPVAPSLSVEERVRRYERASTLADPHVRRELALSIVAAEDHRDLLLAQLRATGRLNVDENRCLTSLHSSIQRMRKAAGVLVMQAPPEEEEPKLPSGAELDDELAPAKRPEEAEASPAVDEQALDDELGGAE